jgi:hypothetical protein
MKQSKPDPVPIFTYTLFPVHAFVCGDLWLRESRLRAIIFLPNEKAPAPGAS